MVENSQALVAVVEAQALTKASALCVTRPSPEEARDRRNPVRETQEEAFTPIHPRRVEANAVTTTQPFDAGARVPG